MHVLTFLIIVGELSETFEKGSLGIRWLVRRLGFELLDHRDQGEALGISVLRQVVDHLTECLGVLIHLVFVPTLECMLDVFHVLHYCI